MTSSSFLSRGAFTRKKYNRFLLASTLSWLVSFIDGCADTLLAGILLDDIAVSAVELVQPIDSIICFFAYLFSVGTVAVFSKESGAFRMEKAYQSVGQGVLCSIAISVLLVIGMFFLREPYLSYYQASAEISALAREYYSCEIIFAAVYPVYFIIYQIVAIDGDESCCFVASLISALTNLVSSYLLAIPFGVKGLSYGSIIGVVAAILAYSSHFFKKTNSVHIRLHFNLKEVLDVIKTGSAVSMTLLYVALIDIVMNRFVIARFGDAYLPAYAVINFMLNIGAMFTGLYDACSGFIGVAYGEKNPASIRQTMKISYQGAAILSIFLIVVMELAAPNVPSLYGITNPEVHTVSVLAARLIPLSFPFLSIYYVFGSYYPLIGHVMLGHLMSAVYMLIAPLAVAIPLGIAFGFNGLTVGFMFSCFLADLITALVVWMKYGKDAVPLLEEKTDEEAIFHEFYLTESNISALCETVDNELSSRGISTTVKTEVQLILEESYLTILEENQGKKVITECNLLISDHSLRLITRDNGNIFDITNANAKIKDLRSYVLAQLMERNPDRSHTTTISFNRNSYIWQW